MPENSGPIFMTPARQIVSNLDPVRKNRNKLSVFLLFVFVSTILWLLIKLTDDYTMTFNLPVNYVDLPNDKWLAEQTDQTLKLSINSRGFVILRVGYLSKVRQLTVSLESTPYRKRSLNSYYVNTVNLRNLIAEIFSINETDIEFEETELRFKLDNLAQKRLAVKPNLAINYKKQYNASAYPVLDPDSVWVYGPENMLDTMQAIHTQQLQLKDVEQDVNMHLELAFDEKQIRLQPSEVTLKVAVDRFTEASFTIPIRIPGPLHLKTFPDRVQVNFMVSLSDFNKVEAAQFQVELDTSGISLNVNALRLKLSQSPPMAKNITMSPESVEYIRIKQ
jgi:hypothetical protein